MSRLCVVSFKECWRDSDGRWYSSGGFPVQMTGLASLFDEMTLIIVGCEPQAGGMPLPPGARVVPLRAPAGTDFQRKLSVVKDLPYYVRTIGRELRDADVVHTPLPGDIALLGFLTALACRKRLFARYGGSWSATRASTLMNRVTRQSMRLAARGRHVMLATGAGEQPPAPGMEWIFASAISRREVATIHSDLTRPAARPLRLVYAGRLSQEKGVRFLVQAFAELRAGEDDPSALPHLTMLGDGPLRAELARMARESGCDAAIDFRGQVAREVLLRELSTHDVCVLPSLTESFCKARLDAMLCGVPVVTTAVGFGREIVGQDGERGWIVPPADPSALAAVLRRVAVEPLDWPALRRRCRAFGESLTIEAWVARIGETCARTWGCTLAEGKLQL